MKAQLMILLTVLNLMAGCAQGYYETRPAYHEETSPQLNQNPETQEQYEQRIWQEESHPGG
jgi:uncharacterized protein YneF (UPF0154 family)